MKITTRIASILTMAITLMVVGPSVPSNANDDCGFGSETDWLSEGLDITEDVLPCTPLVWSEDDFNDGFSKTYSISIDADTSEQGTFDGQLTIACTKKKLYVWTDVEYADGFGWSGSGQLRFDKGKPSAMPYFIYRNFDGIEIKNSAAYMRNFVKAKKKVSMKIGTVDGWVIGEFPKSDLLSYRTAFANRGCKF